MTAIAGGTGVAASLALLSSCKDSNRVTRERQAAIAAIRKIETEGLIRRIGLPAFLTFWSKEVISRLRSARFPLDRLQQQVVQADSILLPPASKQALDGLEARLGVQLPSSLRSFLTHSNGVSGIINYQNADRDFFSSEQIGWLHEQSPDLIRDWMSAGGFPPVPDAVYFKYGNEQDVVNIRNEYLKRMITLGPVIDGGVFMLNPQVRFDDGELEVWDFSVKYPGAIRYQALAPLLEKFCQGSCWNLEYWSASHGWKRETQ